MLNEKIANKVTELKQPSKLHNSGDKIILQTVPAQQVLLGKTNETGPIGLQQFCNRMAALWQASGKDDPYADQIIMKAYNHIIRLRRLITKTTAEFSEKIKQPTGIVLEIRESEHPVSYTIAFKTPYCYMSAYLLSDFDKLCRIILSVKYAALLEEREDPEQIIRDIRKKLRQLLSIPLQWNYSGVSRNDIKVCNQIATKAAGLNKFEIEPAILNNEKRAPYSPRVRAKKDS